jgi:hypothetical protein
MFYAIAGIFFAGGAYLYLSPAKDITTKDLSAVVIPSSMPANVATAIEILKEIFQERCSTLEADLLEFEGAGIMAMGYGNRPRAIVWPESTEDVRTILKVADTYQVAVVPFSGGTSLEGYLSLSHTPDILSRVFLDSFELVAG